MYKRIKDLREDNDYSQEYISKFLGCSRSNYAMCESGDVKISIEQLVKLADIYHTNTDYLLGLTNSKCQGDAVIPYDKEKVAHNIRILRKERNLSQSFLSANVLNCTQSSYSQYETGKRTVNVDTIVSLAKFYNVRVDFLIGRIETPLIELF